MSPDERDQLAATCRRHSWALLTPRLAAMRIDAAAGPRVLVQLLDQVSVQLQAEARHLLHAMGRHAWAVQSLDGPYHAAARLGFRVEAGQRRWWLHFEHTPRLRISRIERLGP